MPALVSMRETTSMSAPSLAPPPRAHFRAGSRPSAPQASAPLFSGVRLPPPSGPVREVFASQTALLVRFQSGRCRVRMPFGPGFVLFRYFRVLIGCAEFATFADPNDSVYEIDFTSFAVVRAVLRLLCPTARYALHGYGRGAFRRGRGAQGQNVRMGQGAGRPACDFGIPPDRLRMER